jgi:erythromycin esterase-like protein
MTTDIGAFLDAYGLQPELLALGEPTHGEPALPQFRNEFFEALTKRGFRSVALESDRVAGLIANAYVQGERADFTGGLSHGFGDYPANRDLLVWMREYNATRPASERLTFYGFDAPLETMSAPSPRAYLKYAHDFLALDRWPEIDGLLGTGERWSDTAAIMDFARSVGLSADARALRVIADDVLFAVWKQAPRFADDMPGWRRAELHAEAALGLLRYHAQAAEELPQTERIARLSEVRDTLMARNLLTIRAIEAGRGPTLVFAHNSHLQRNPARWSLGGMEVEVSGAGSIVGPLLGDRYVFIAGSLGASPALGIPTPPPETIEGRLPYGLSSAKDVQTTTPRAGMQIYFPLDADILAGADGILHVVSGFDPATLAGRILALPGVDQLVASEENGAPEGSWGDRFFYVGPDRRRPFATIVEHDVPGFDEDSELNRPGVFRLNVELGRTEFARRFGFEPAQFEDHRAEFDFARTDRLVPHPGYALHGWAGIVVPGPHLLDELDTLLAHAHARAVDRHERAGRRQAS